MSKKVSWVEIDIRVRARRGVWTQQERGDLEDALKKLPDLSDEAQVIELPQPALAGSKIDATVAN